MEREVPTRSPGPTCPQCGKKMTINMRTGQVTCSCGYQNKVQVS